MSKNKGIEIYLRVRPNKRKFSGLTVTEEENKCNIFIPKNTQQGLVNNNQEYFSFVFDKLFPMPTKQEEVFEGLAKEVCDSAIEGYNGTIFAYGQTGSGKTFTMTGGAERYADRGIIPRTISYLFEQSAKSQETIINLSISYIEIYGNSGYDLLDANHSSKKLEDLPKVVPRETENEEIILTGLSVHKAQTEEDALNLLFIGDTNRVVCETPMNDASTRSHCIFILMIEARKPNSDVKTVSRIHLVDLSGSERIGKTGVTGKLQTEALGINSSLSFLELVIICLNKRAMGENVHIPYRNSLMTLVLRDSLGGNCKTRMIATVSPDDDDLAESISTCKFAYRVALIKNVVQRNEAVDPGIIIERLKRENEQLRAEITLLKGGNSKESLDGEDIENCKKKVLQFIETKDPSQTIILSDRLQINECFFYFKHLYNDMIKKGGTGGGTGNTNMNVKQPTSEIQNKSDKPQQDTADYQQNSDEIKRLKLLVQQRDNEIMILLNLVNKNKNVNENQQIVLPVSSSDGEQSMFRSILRESKAITFPKPPDPQDIEQSLKQQPKLNNYTSMSGTKGSDLSQFTAIQDNYVGKQPTKPLPKSEVINNLQEVQQMLLYPLNLSNEQLMDRANCFELFRKSYRKNQVMEENKEILKEKFVLARELGANVNDARAQINNLKNRIEDLRKDQAIQGLMDENSSSQHPEELKLQSEIEKYKKIYKDNFDKLKDSKSEIQRIQMLLERNKDKLQKDFEQWLDVIVKQKQEMMGQMGQIMQNNSIVSNKSQNLQNMSQEISKVNDKEVEKKLEAFYKARDQIYNN